MLLEDEHGTINLIVPPPVVERCRLAVRTSGLRARERQAGAPRGDHQRGRHGDRAPASGRMPSGPSAAGVPAAWQRRGQTSLGCRARKPAEASRATASAAMSPSWRRRCRRRTASAGAGASGQATPARFPANRGFPSEAEPRLPAMTAKIIDIRERLLDAADLVVDFATLGEYGLEPEPVRECERRPDRACASGAPHPLHDRAGVARAPRRLAGRSAPQSGFARGRSPRPSRAPTSSARSTRPGSTFSGRVGRPVVVGDDAVVSPATKVMRAAAAGEDRRRVVGEPDRAVGSLQAQIGAASADIRPAIGARGRDRRPTSSPSPRAAGSAAWRGRRRCRS